MRQSGPVMVATLEPGLAWMDMATVDGCIRRRHPGNPPAPALAVAAAAAVAGGGAAPLALPRFPGAISFPIEVGPGSIRFRVPTEVGPLAATGVITWAR